MKILCTVTLKKRDLRHMLREIRHEFPLLGIAGRVAMNPLVGIVGLVIFAFARARKAAEEFQHGMKILCTVAALVLLVGCTSPSKRELQKEYEGWPIKPWDAQMLIHDTQLRLAQCGLDVWLVSSPV